MGAVVMGWLLGLAGIASAAVRDDVTFDALCEAIVGPISVLAEGGSAEQVVAGTISERTTTQTLPGIRLEEWSASNASDRVPLGADSDLAQRVAGFGRSVTDLSVSFDPHHLVMRDDRYELFGILTLAGRREQQRAALWLEADFRLEANPLPRLVEIDLSGMGTAVAQGGFSDVTRELLTGDDALLWRSAGESAIHALDRGLGGDRLGVGDLLALDLDGAPALLWGRTAGAPNVLLRWTGDRFEDVAAQLGVDYLDGVSAIANEDLDGDGVEELLLGGTRLTVLRRDAGQRFEVAQVIEMPPRAIATALCPFQEVSTETGGRSGLVYVGTHRVDPARAWDAIPHRFADAQNGPPDIVLRNDSVVGQIRLTPITEETPIARENWSLTTAVAVVDRWKDPDPQAVGESVGLVIAADHGVTRFWEAGERGEFTAPPESYLPPVPDHEGNRSEASDRIVQSRGRARWLAPIRSDHFELALGWAGSGPGSLWLMECFRDDVPFSARAFGTRAMTRPVQHDALYGRRMIPSWGETHAGCAISIADDVAALWVGRGGWSRPGRAEIDLERSYWHDFVSPALREGQSEEQLTALLEPFAAAVRRGAAFAADQPEQLLVRSEVGPFGWLDLAPVLGIGDLGDVRSLAAFDWDGDGDEDLAVVCRGTPGLRLLRNDLDEAGPADPPLEFDEPSDAVTIELAWSVPVPSVSVRTTSDEEIDLASPGRPVVVCWDASPVGPLAEMAPHWNRALFEMPPVAESHVLVILRQDDSDLQRWSELLVDTRIAHPRSLAETCLHITAEGFVDRIGQGVPPSWAALGKSEMARFAVADAGRWIDGAPAALAVDWLTRVREAGLADWALQSLRRLTPDGLPGAWDFERGAALTESGRPRGAVQHLEKVQPEHERYADAVAMLGRALFRLREPRALAVLEQAVDLAPVSVPLRLTYGDALIRSDELEAGAEEYRMATYLAPDDYDAQLKFGMNIAKVRYRGRAQEGLDALDRAAALEPELAEPWIEAAVVERVLRNWDGARERLVKAVELAPDEPRCYFELATTELAAEDVDAAEAALNRARELAPDNPQIAELSAAVRERRGGGS